MKAYWRFILAALRNEKSTKEQREEAFVALCELHDDTICLEALDATTAPNVEGVGYENGMEVILCENKLGQKPKKCRIFILEPLICDRFLGDNLGEGQESKLVGPTTTCLHPAVTTVISTALDSVRSLN
ncbi:hypothetical protein PRIPAC_70658 [Pristionchus pacificus]|uniref:Uncharacterized protein n=1 Tax=Pristionchus pacificus TaxID=54126 RepID=A0A2A6CR86_PRIPA|nr:hypothetical protein PRIPAC_70658 [Pristionchus pacificus]|eukprot:PDM80732.1 hypothetical protein PRIPAC_35735 [Pristionchus pacificus]